MTYQPPSVTPPPPPPPTPPPSDPYGYGYGYPPGQAPMAALAYSVPAGAARPGIITAIGVISIVVASLSFLANLYTGGSLFVFSMMANFAGAMGPTATTPGPIAPGNAPTAAGPTTAPLASRVVLDDADVEPAGMPSANRATVAQGLSELQFLSAPRLEQLDEMLGKSGTDIFAELGDSPTPAEVGNAVLGHGASPSATPGSPGPDYFRTKEGRFELYDDRAVFYPARGSDVVRTSTLTTTNPGLTPAQVQAVVQQAQAASGNTMNPSQATALSNLLSAPGQQFVSPINLPTAVRSAMALGDGSVMVTFPNGFATFGPQGQTSSVTNNMMTTGAGAAMFGRVRPNGAAMALSGFATVAGIGLSVYLLVIGIMVLRQSPRGRKLHLIYAVLKIPVTILGAAATWWLTTSFMEAMLVNMGPAAPTSGMISSSIGIQQVFLGVVGLIYPVALLIALQTRTVKDYYNSVVT